MCLIDQSINFHRERENPTGSTYCQKKQYDKHFPKQTAELLVLQTFIWSHLVVYINESK